MLPHKKSRIDKENDATRYSNGKVQLSLVVPLGFEQFMTSSSSSVRVQTIICDQAFFSSWSVRDWRGVCPTNPLQSLTDQEFIGQTPLQPLTDQEEKKGLIAVSTDNGKTCAIR